MQRIEIKLYDKFLDNDGLFHRLSDIVAVADNLQFTLDYNGAVATYITKHSWCNTDRYFMYKIIISQANFVVK